MNTLSKNKTGVLKATIKFCHRKRFTAKLKVETKATTATTTWPRWKVSRWSTDGWPTSRRSLLAGFSTGMKGILKLTRRHQFIGVNVTGGMNGVNGVPSGTRWSRVATAAAGWLIEDWMIWSHYHPTLR